LASSPCAFLAALVGSVELRPRRLCRPRCIGRLALLLETDTSFHDVSFFFKKNSYPPIHSEICLPVLSEGVYRVVHPSLNFGIFSEICRLKSMNVFSLDLVEVYTSIH
jgi:hypothetical protein